MASFRDSKPGQFYLDRERVGSVERQSAPPFMRFAASRGAAADLWSDAWLPSGADHILGAAGLLWPVGSRKVSTPSREGQFQAVGGFKALVRPDRDVVMSIVSEAYVPAENLAVADAALSLARRVAPQARLVAAAGFGRRSERTLFVVRVGLDDGDALCLLAHNTHGGGGAVGFELVEASRSMGTVFVAAGTNSSHSVAHVGRVGDNLERMGRHSSWVERYLNDVPPIWSRMTNTLWSPRRTRALIRDLWGETPTLHPKTPDGRDLDPNESVFRHPGNVLPARLDDCDDAASAFRSLCDFVDNESEACERGDFTKDRDERLALGAGSKLKQRAWRWIIDNTM